jgi:hypothetical protein
MPEVPSTCRSATNTMRIRLLTGLILGVLAPLAGGQVLLGNVATVGFPAAGPTGQALRPGAWFPIRVDLAVQGSELFTGRLEYEGVDLDGDRVHYQTRLFTIAPRPDGRPRPLWLYGVANSVGEMPEYVRVLDEAGATVLRLRLPPCEMLHPDNLLVLDISRQPVPQLPALVVPNAEPDMRSDADRPYYRKILVSSLAAAQLPDQWWGLEAVDVIVWDEPAPAELSVAQLDALAGWVAAGGQLVLGVGGTIGALEASPLAELLPLAPGGGLKQVQRLPVFRARCAAPGAPAALTQPIQVTTADLRPDATRIIGEPGDINLVSMRLHGSGRVVATAATLRELVQTGVETEPFYGMVLDLSAYLPAYRQSVKEKSTTWETASAHLYGDFVDPIAFGTATAVRGTVALLFVGTYIVVATLVSWAWLRQRGMTQQNWNVFAAIAIVASVLSLGTVGALRGLSGGVQSLAVLDLAAGQTTARGPVLFGYRSPTRQRPTITLPGERTFLRPLSRGGAGLPSFYVTPERYTAVPTRAQLDGVLLRATLKQFEGYWTGELPGTITADLVVDRGTGRLTPQSWISNDLDVDLVGAYLLYVDPRLAAPDVPRPPGQTTRYPVTFPDGLRQRIQFDVDRYPPAVSVIAQRFGGIRSREQLRTLAARDYQQIDRDWTTWARRSEPKLSDMPNLPTLWEQQQLWRGNVRFGGLISGLPPSVRATLLASTFNLHLPNLTRDFSSVATPLSVDGLPRLDVTHWLLGGRTQGTGVLVCWSPAPAPVALTIDGEARSAFDGVTVYRVQVPIRYTGQAPSLRSSQP